MDEGELVLADLLAATKGGRRNHASVQFAAYSRNIVPADLVEIVEGPPVADPLNPIKRLRTQHHHLARLLSMGLKEIEVAAATGYTVNRISILKGSPAFQELMAFYKAQADTKFGDVIEKLAGLGETVVEELKERLEEAPEDFSVNQLLNLGAFALDRSSAPPKTKANSSGGGGMPMINISFHEGPGDPGLLIEQKPAPETIEYRPE